MKRGFTLIEVILAISLIGILAVSFMPAITFGFTNLIGSQKFTLDIFASQELMEKEIEEKKDSGINGTDSLNIFGVNVKGYNINKVVSTHGEINFFKPNFVKEYDTPELVAKGHSGVPSIVMLTKDKTTTPSDSVTLFNTDGSVNNVLFTADGNKYKVKDEHKGIHLMNVYRWYTTSEVGYPNTNLDSYLVIKEWNAARNLVSYEKSKESNFIPNMQNDPVTNQPTYHKFTFNEVKQGLSLFDEDLINNYGNRYLYYTVTPYAVSGKVGREYYSNAIYISAPKIEIENAKYIIGEDTVTIRFKDSIKNSFVQQSMSFNDSLGEIVGITLNPNSDKEMRVQFNRTIDSNTAIEGNVFYKGAVLSAKYSNISIWSDNKPTGEFKIVPRVLVKEWNFNNSVDGWTAINNIINFVWQDGGYIGGDITGGDPYFHSPDLNINTDNVNMIRVRLKNDTTSNMAQIFYRTSAGGWHSDRRVDFSIDPKSDFIVYDIDVGSAGSWSDNLYQLRIDPAVNATGTFSIDYVKFYD